MKFSKAKLSFDKFLIIFVLLNLSQIKNKLKKQKNIL